MSERFEVKNPKYISSHGKKLTDTNDSFEPTQPTDPDCTVEQLANNNLSGKQILFNDDLIDYMDNTNKAAMYLHEALYSVLNEEADETTSLRIRRLVGLVFSGQVLEPAYKKLTTPRYACENGEGDPKTKINFMTVIEEGISFTAMVPEVIADVPMIGYSRGEYAHYYDVENSLKDARFVERSRLVGSPVDFDLTFTLRRLGLISDVNGEKIYGVTIALRNSAGGQKHLTPIKLSCKLVK